MKLLCLSGLAADLSQTCADQFASCARAQHGLKSGCIFGVLHPCSFVSILSASSLVLSVRCLRAACLRLRVTQHQKGIAYASLDLPCRLKHSVDDLLSVEGQEVRSGGAIWMHLVLRSPGHDQNAPFLRLSPIVQPLTWKLDLVIMFTFCSHEQEEDRPHALVYSDPLTLTEEDDSKLFVVRVTSSREQRVAR